MYVIAQFIFSITLYFIEQNHARLKLKYRNQQSVFPAHSVLFPSYQRAEFMKAKIAYAG